MNITYLQTDAFPCAKRRHLQARAQGQLQVELQKPRPLVPHQLKQYIHEAKSQKKYGRSILQYAKSATHAFNQLSGPKK
jgi:3-deoxy-D-manno-octulosonic acid (KDO) 8-phosphate synthase